MAKKESAVSTIIERPSIDVIIIICEEAYNSIKTFYIKGDIF